MPPLDKKVSPRVPSCPLCWDKKHECQRDPTTGVCRGCSEYTLKGDGFTPTLAKPFYAASTHAQIYKGLKLRTLSTLDTEAFCSRALRIYITTSNGKVSCSPLKLFGRFNSENPELVRELDGMVLQSLAAKLSAQDAYSEAINNAVLAGGYMHLLCSPTRITEETYTFLDGIATQNEYDGYNLEAHFKYLIVCRLEQLIKQVVEAARLSDFLAEFQEHCSSVYAGIAILRHKLYYFADGLKCGKLGLMTQMSAGLKVMLVDWFNSVERELTDRIRLGCRLFPNWQKLIKGSLKSFRRRDETLSLALILYQYKTTPTHVSSPMSSQDDSLEETSDTASLASGTVPGHLF